MGNKCDLNASREIEFSKAKEFADKLGIQIIETSAKDSTNVEQAFSTMAHKLVSELSSQVKQDTINLQAPPQTISNGYCCSYF